MGVIIDFPGRKDDQGMKLLTKLPEDLYTYVVTGYTDLRKSIPGLSQILEAYELDPRSRSISFFCGRRIDRFKAFMYDGDGFIVMTKRFDSKKLKWPRNGGRDDGELWYLTNEQFERWMSGEHEINEKEIDEGEDIVDPPVNKSPNTLFWHTIEERVYPRRIYLRTGYTDLRHSIDTYCDIADQYGLDSQADTYFLFCGKRTDLMKVLYYDGDGYMLISKRFDSTHLKWPREENEMWDVIYSQFMDFLAGKELSREKICRIFEPKA